MKKALFYIFLLTVVAIGCTTNKTEGKLRTVDSLLAEENFSSALTELNKIKASDLKEDENRAYYNLLRTQTLYSLYKPIPNDSMIDESIKFYEKHPDGDKVARAYYYKGELTCLRGENSKGIIFTKKAEQMANKKNNILQHHICEALMYYNCQVHEYELSLNYAKKAVFFSRKMQNVDWELYALNIMAINYLNLNQSDSTIICLNKCLNLLNFASEEGKSYVLGDLGRLFQKIDPVKAEQFINEAIKLSPDGGTYAILASFYYTKGEKEKVEPLLKKAINNANSKQKFIVLQVWRDYKMAEKQYKEANELSIELSNLKDSIQKANKAQDLKAVQTAFDNQIKEEKSKRTMSYAALAIVLLVATVVAMTFYYKYKDAKLEQQLEQDRREIERINLQIDAARKAIAENEALRADKEKEIKRLQRETAKVEQRHSGILADGRQRYLEITGGKTTVTWTKDCFRNFVEYYKIVSPEFASVLDNDYSMATYKNKTLLILENMGNTIKDIASIMGTSETAVRMARSRMKKKKA